jgi:hypothetical protein
MFEYLTLAALVVIILVREFQHAEQIRDLTTKLRARTMEEYLLARQFEVVPKSPLPEVPPLEPVPLDHLEPDQALKILTDNLDKLDKETHSSSFEESDEG